jgi:transposase
MNREEHALGASMDQIEPRAHHNVFVVALANKLARITWAVLAKEKIYHPLPAIQISSV